MCIYIVPYDPPFHPIDPSSYLDNIKILDNDIQPGYFADDASANSGQGIVTAITNIADPTAEGAIYITNLTISGNTIHPVDAATGADRAIVINPGVANATISNNTITGKYLAGSLVSGVDGNVVVSDNQFDGISDNSLVPSWGFYDARWGAVKIVNNEFSGSTEAPIMVDYAAVYQITENTFTDIMNGTAAAYGNVAVHQFLGTDDPFYSQYDPYDPSLSTHPVGFYMHNTPYIYGQPESRGDYAGTGDGYYVDYIPASYTVEYYQDSIAPENQIGTAVPGARFLTDAIEPLTDAVVTADLGDGWLDARRPDGYDAGAATFPAASAVIADNVVKVLYLPFLPGPTPTPTPTDTVLPAPTSSDGSAGGGGAAGAGTGGMASTGVDAMRIGAVAALIVAAGVSLVAWRRWQVQPAGAAGTSR